MKIAVVGSRGIETVDLEKYLPKECDEIVSGGAKGVDQCAAEYARRKQIKLTEFFPQYEKYGRAAPIRRNYQIVEYADQVLAFWDGTSKGTLSVIKYCEKTNTPHRVVTLWSEQGGGT